MYKCIVSEKFCVLFKEIFKVVYSLVICTRKKEKRHEWLGNSSFKKGGRQKFFDNQWFKLVWWQSESKHANTPPGGSSARGGSYSTEKE